MNTYRVSIIVNARSRPEALSKLDKAWFDLDPNLDFVAEKLVNKNDKKD